MFTSTKDADAPDRWSSHVTKGRWLDATGGGGSDGQPSGRIWWREIAMFGLTVPASVISDRSSGNSRLIGSDASGSCSGDEDEWRTSGSEGLRWAADDSRTAIAGL